MEFLLSSYTILVLVVWLYMSLWFVISLVLRRNDVADVAWGLGFLVVVLTTLSLTEIISTRALIIASLVGVWAVRLSVHIAARNRTKGEDYRYRTWRETWGKWFYSRTYGQVFLLQGALMLGVVSPAVIGILFEGGALSVLDYIGILLWMFGFFFEVVGDWQLSRFMKDPQNKGKLLSSGLWQYTRHPNYFGEVTQWWAIWLLALSVPFGVWGIVGPLLITFLILKISGVPLLEAKMQSHPDFPLYARRTSVFIPWFPKKD